ncbi:hypothetical protein HNV12_01040 [Methanococcoides sp. SA1]|nr:hypothetical protein [Methanococcoides sp. SA1]
MSEGCEYRGDCDAYKGKFLPGILADRFEDFCDFGEAAELRKTCPCYEPMEAFVIISKLARKAQGNLDRMIAAHDDMLERLGRS